MVHLKQMLIETKKELHNELVDQQNDFWMQDLQDKRKHIDNAQKYAGEQDTSWWDVFFNDQQEIVDNCIAGS